jgi:hypothetical protein
VDLVLLQFLARNMFRHESSPAFIGIPNRSTGRAQLACPSLGVSHGLPQIYPCSM